MSSGNSIPLVLSYAIYCFYWVDFAQDMFVVSTPNDIKIPPVTDIFFRAIFFSACDMDAETADNCGISFLPSFEVRGTIQTTTTLEDCKPFVDKLRTEFVDVLSNAESACSFAPEVRGPFGVAHIALKPDARPIKKEVLSDVSRKRGSYDCLYQEITR